MINQQFSRNLWLLSTVDTQADTSEKPQLFADKSGNLHRMQWHHKIGFAIQDWLTAGKSKIDRQVLFEEKVYSTFQSVETYLGKLERQRKVEGEELVIQPKSGGLFRASYRYVIQLSEKKDLENIIKDLKISEDSKRKCLTTAATIVEKSKELIRDKNVRNIPDRTNI